MGLLDVVPAGVLTGDNVRKLFDYCREHAFAIPAVNVSSSSTINCALEAARDVRAPLIIQVSQGGAQFYAGKGLSNDGQKASTLGAVAAAHHVRAVAKDYGIPVVLHSDHCAKKLLPWFDGMLAANEAYFKEHGEPLFSSHMLDLSEESKEENIELCRVYFERMAKINLFLEMEIGVTGGEEDGVDNTNVDNSRLYTQPEDVWDVYRTLSPISDLFSIAAAFGNVHGVYKPGNVKLSPFLLDKHQKYIAERLSEQGKLPAGAKGKKPALLVFHGGSGSMKNEITEAVGYGVVKMNVDTDTQWAYWEGIKDYYKKNEDSLQQQVGNSKDPGAPNKKYYDPRVYVREAEKSMAKRVKQACEDLGNVNRL